MKIIVLIFSVLIVFSLLLSGCANILSMQVSQAINEHFTGVGIENDRNWATNNFPIGATENEILQRLGPPESKSDNVWFYPVPKNFQSLQNATVAVFFFENKIITWLVYFYRNSPPVKVVAQDNYKTISIGASEDDVLKELGKPIYRGSNIWTFWKEPVIKYDLWGNRPVENTVQVVIIYEKKVIAILCFNSVQYYGQPFNLSFTSIMVPVKDREGARDYWLKQNEKK